MQQNNKSFYFKSFIAGFVIGTLGGLIGLGGAEFRLPLLVSLFHFGTLDAVMINKVTSLVVVFFSLPARSQSIPWNSILEHWTVIVYVLSGSLVGAWIGATHAVRIKTQTLNQLIFILLVLLALGMIFGHNTLTLHHTALVQRAPFQLLAGVLSGLVIGMVAAILGVAGGELIIPTLVLLFGIDIKLAGSLSLCISLPTMLVAFARYSQSGAIALLRKNTTFITVMALGSIAGSFTGGQLVGYVSSSALIFGLGIILSISAYKTFLHHAQ